jgi:hypothetical protein
MLQSEGDRSVYNGLEEVTIGSVCRYDLDDKRYILHFNRDTARRMLA